MLRPFLGPRGKEPGHLSRPWSTYLTLSSVPRTTYLLSTGPLVWDYAVPLDTGANSSKGK